MGSQQIVFYNNAQSTLAGSISNTSTVANLAAGGGALFSPPPTGGQYFVATFVPAGGGNLNEIVHVTGVVGDQIQLVRAQEGTTALPWNAGDIFAALTTAGEMQAMMQQNQFVSFAGNPNGNVAGTQSAPPLPPTFCWDINDQVLFACETTGTTSTAVWAETVQSNSIPTGIVIPFAGSSVPSGFLLCSGQAVSRTTYATLFSLIGSTYGSGDGSTTFNVPDLRGNLIAGIDNMGGTPANRLTTATITNPDALGSTGGTEGITLTSAQMPSHTHPITDPGHLHSITDPGHFHALTANAMILGPPAIAYLSSTVTSFPVGTNATGIDNTSSAGTGISGTGGSTTGITNQNTGGGGSHLNVQPTMVMNYIIKT